MKSANTPTAYDRQTGYSPGLRQGPHTPSRIVKRNGTSAGSSSALTQQAQLVQLTSSVDNVGGMGGATVIASRAGGGPVPEQRQIDSSSVGHTHGLLRSGRRESTDSPLEEIDDDNTESQIYTPIDKSLTVSYQQLGQTSTTDVYASREPTPVNSEPLTPLPAATSSGQSISLSPQNNSNSSNNNNNEEDTVMQPAAAAAATATSTSIGQQQQHDTIGGSRIGSVTSPTSQSSNDNEVSHIGGMLPAASHHHPQQQQPRGGAGSSNIEAAAGGGTSSRGSERGGEAKATPPTRVNIGKKELIGVGSFGKVYRAMDLDTNRIIAVKEILLIQSDDNSDAQKQIKKLEREVQVMQRLLHPNIVQYLGARRYEEYLHIYMEFVPGGTVASLLKTFGPLQEKQAAQYTRQILQGLSYLHHKKIAHRDLKGDNLFVDVDGTLKLGDFGTSKEIQSVHLTQSVTGTPYFMAPEVINCSGHNLEADIWSVGCCVIQMLTGKPPFYGADNHLAVMLQVSKGKMESQIPPNITDQARDFICCCTKQKPGERWSCDQLLLHPWIASQSPQTPQSQRRGDSRGTSNVREEGPVSTLPHLPNTAVTVTATPTTTTTTSSAANATATASGGTERNTGSRNGSAASGRGTNQRPSSGRVGGGLPPRTPVKTPPEGQQHQLPPRNSPPPPHQQQQSTPTPTAGRTAHSSSTPTRQGGHGSSGATPKKKTPSSTNLTSQSLRKDRSGSQPKHASTPKKSGH